jgi:hypothetical protein
MTNPLPIPHAEINLFETIPYSLQVVFKGSGKPVPGATISNVSISIDNPIGQILPGSDPTTGIFKPSEPGNCTLTFQATVTLP